MVLGVILTADVKLLAVLGCQSCPHFVNATRAINVLRSGKSFHAFPVAIAIAIKTKNTTAEAWTQ
jgi:hypothetical protein